METSSFFSPQSSLPNSIGIFEQFDNEKLDSRAMGLSKSPVTVRSKFSDNYFQLFYYQIRGNKILKYSYSELRSSLQKEQIETINEAQNETYRGEMTVKSARKLRKKVQIWWDAVQHYNNRANVETVRDLKKFVFLTLTLSANQIHSDQEIKLKILKPFFRVLRDRYGVRNYLWKAESQENGRIHFHVLIDHYIDMQKVMNEWNKCQNVLGYVDEFKKKYKHCHPPSTRIEAVRNQQQLMIYFEKYIEKDEGYRRIEGAVWKGSQSVMSLQFFEFVGDSEVEQAIVKAENENKIIRFDEQRYSIYTLQNSTVDEILPNYIVNQRSNYLNLLSSFMFKDEIVNNFRDYCFLFTNEDLIQKNDPPLIVKKEHPLPVQLTLFEVREIFNIKKLRRL